MFSVSGKYQGKAGTITTFSVFPYKLNQFFSIAGAKMKLPPNNQMGQLAKVLDAESYSWLSANHPEIAEAIETEVQKGTTPARIRFFVLKHTGREELALRCEAAARHVAELMIST